MIYHTTPLQEQTQVRKLTKYDKKQINVDAHNADKQQQRKTRETWYNMRYENTATKK